DDSLDGEVDEARFTTEAFRHLLAHIRQDDLSPEEAFRLKDEATWENAKREEREEGKKLGLDEGKKLGLDEGKKLEGERRLREGILDLCEVLGIEVTPARR